MNERFRLALICLAPLLLAACAGSGGAKTEQHIAEAMQEAALRSAQTPPPEVTAALIPPLQQALDPVALAYREPRFRVAVDDVPARVFFMSLVEGTTYNMVVGPQLEGNISLHLREVTLPEVMEVVREAFGYEYRRNGNTFLVQPPALRTQVFEVDYLNLKRSGSSLIRVSSGQSTQTTSSNPSGQAAEMPVVSDRQLSEQAFGTRIETQSEAAFWQGLEASLSALIGSESGRSVVVNPLSGVVVVRALPAELREVGKFVGAVQTIAERQVILEAKIIEVELRDGFQAGIDWALLNETSKSRVLAGQHRPAGGAGGTGGAGSTASRILDLFDEQGGFQPFTPAGGLGASPFGGAFSAALRYKDFAAFVELLETQGRTQVLSSPRVATVNNQKAVIKVGSDEFFVTGVTSQTTTGGGAAATNRNIILTPFFSGIALDVTPQISADGDVILHVHPMVSEVVDQTKTFTVGGLSESLPLAFSTVREADSIVRTRSGHVVVIGGMMKDSSVQDRGQVPLLGRLPGVGNLFRHNQQRQRKSELVILLRATVVDDKASRDELEAAAQRLRDLGAQRTGW